MSEIHGAVGSYVVNALDGAELDEFEAHLAVCETCRREVVEFSETAAHLGHLVEATPPPALRGSILSAIQEVRPLPPEVPVDSDTAVPSRPVVTAEPQLPVGGSPVDELAIRRSRRLTRLFALAAAAALVVALGLGAWATNLAQQREAQVAASTLETQLLAAPDLKVVTVPVKNGGQASFRVSKSLNKALFVGDLADPGSGKTYQLWTIDDQAHAKADALLAGGTGTKAWFEGPVDASSALAVTIEPSGGSQQPSMKPLASATL
jgi:anti-sigma factor RsiW